MGGGRDARNCLDARGHGRTSSALQLTLVQPYTVADEMAPLANVDARHWSARDSCPMMQLSVIRKKTILSAPLSCFSVWKRLCSVRSKNKNGAQQTGEFLEAVAPLRSTTGYRVQ